MLLGYLILFINWENILTSKTMPPYEYKSCTLGKNSRLIFTYQHSILCLYLLEPFEVNGDTIQWLNNNNKHWSISFHICKMDNIIIPALNFLFSFIYFYRGTLRKDLREISSNEFLFCFLESIFCLWGKMRQEWPRLLFVHYLFACMCVSVCLTDHPNVAKYIYSLCSLSLTKQHSFQEIVF